MNVGSIPTRLFSRQPLSTLGKLAMIGFLGAGVTSGILAISVGFPNNTALLMVTAGQLVCVGFAVTGARWMPVLLTLVSGVFLYQIATQPFVAYHLTNPKQGGFLEFVLDLII